MGTKIGLHYGYWTQNWDTDYSYYIKKAAHLGFDMVELNSVPFVHMPKSRVEEIKRAAQESGIALSFCGGLKPENDVSSPLAAARKQGIEDLSRMCETVCLMGGQYLSGILHGIWPCHYGLDGSVLNDKLAYWQRAAESLQIAAKNAQNMGVTLNLEVVNRFEQFMLNTAEEGRAFCQMIDRPNVRLLLDTFHMNIEENSITDAIVETDALLGHFHLGENNRMPPGPNGMLNWEEIAQALRHIGYTGDIVMEPFVQMGGEVGRDICVWRNLVQNHSEAALDELIAASLGYIRRLVMP